MSIASEITRLQGVKSDILQAIADKGVTVPVGSALDDCPGLIASISSGGEVEQIAYSSFQKYTLIVDSNGYIGSKQRADGYTYYVAVDPVADFSQSGLGQITLIIPEIGETVIGGRTYKTTKIGTQTWLAENLDYKFNVNGSQIPIGSFGAPNTPAAWYYNNDETTYGINGNKCGLLYNWYSVDYLNQNRLDLCPGWHVPSTDEYDDLATFIGGASTAGLFLKANDLQWATSWFGADTYKFNVLPTGYRTNSFSSVGVDCGFWTSSSVDSNHAKNRYFLASINSMQGNDYNEKINASPIRLVKDSE